VRPAFAAAETRQAQAKLKAPQECDDECVPAEPQPSIIAPPLAVCDVEYDRDDVGAADAADAEEAAGRE